ncbi:MAG: CinA family nicotinamide mononucleotide deamidase-related protein [Bacteroidales bacterium]
MIEASLLTIGDEILIGQIVDSNSAFIARTLNTIGVKVAEIVSIGDEGEEIISALDRLTSNYKIVIVTGGLGPTNDDITKKTISTFFNCNSFILAQEQLDQIERIFALRGSEVTQLNYQQALVPANCEVIVNHKGTAPAMLFKTEGGGVLFSLPGVPYEMEALMDKVVDIIKGQFELPKIYHKTISTYGVAESHLAERLAQWESTLPNGLKLAYLPNPSTGIKLRLSLYNGGDDGEGGKVVEQYGKELKSILTPSLQYGEDYESLSTVVINLLKKENKTLSIAESCTGGRISSTLTQIPGVSSILKGGVVAYSNSSKIELLKVDPTTLERYGAVSRECAEAMAIGCKRLFNTNFAIATTGVAGPDGGSIEKPIGTIWIAVATPKKVFSFIKRLTNDRERNIIRGSSEALNLLRKVILNLE